MFIPLVLILVGWQSRSPAEGQSLLWLVNASEAEQTSDLWLDDAKLIGKRAAKLRDLETGEEMARIPKKAGGACATACGSTSRPLARVPRPRFGVAEKKAYLCARQPFIQHSSLDNLKSRQYIFYVDERQSASKCATAGKSCSGSSLPHATAWTSQQWHTLQDDSNVSQYEYAPERR